LDEIEEKVARLQRINKTKETVSSLSGVSDQTGRKLKREGFRKRQLVESSIVLGEVKAGRGRSASVSSTPREP